MNFKRLGLFFTQALFATLAMSAQSRQLTMQEAKAIMSGSKSLRHVTVHDPSITYDAASKS